MIFKALYRRRVKRLFAPLMPADQQHLLDDMGENVSEWEAFKLVVMPERTLKQMARAHPEGLVELKNMIEETLSKGTDDGAPNRTSDGIRQPSGGLSKTSR